MKVKLICFGVLAIGFLLCTNVIAGDLKICVTADGKESAHAAVALKGPNDLITSLKGYTDSSGCIEIGNLMDDTTYGYVVDWRDEDGKLWRGAGGVDITFEEIAEISIDLMEPGTFIPDWSPWV